MLILILIDVQYLQNIVFSFEKGLNSQNYPIKKFPQQNSYFLPHQKGGIPTPTL